MKKSFIGLLLAIILIFSIQCLPVRAADDVVDVKVSGQFCNSVTFCVYYYSENHAGWLDFGDGSGIDLATCGQGLIRHDYQNPGDPADDYIASIVTYDTKTYQGYAQKEILVSIPELRAFNSIYPGKAKDKTVTVIVDCFTGLSSLSWGDGTSVSINIDKDDKNLTRTFSHTYTTTDNVPKSYIISLESTLDPDNAENTYYKSTATFTYSGIKESTLEVTKTYIKVWYPPTEVSGIVNFLF